MYGVSLTDEARRFYDRADAALQRKLDRCFDLLGQTPRKHPIVKLLKGRLSGFLRFRVGDYRVVYLVNDAMRTVTVVTVANRRDVYE